MEERPRRGAVPLGRDVDVDELPVLVDRAVDVAPTATAPFTPLLADAARFCRDSPGDRWFTDETYVKINGHWRYVYRAVDQHGQVIDVLVSTRRDGQTAQRSSSTR